MEQGLILQGKRGGRDSPLPECGAGDGRIFGEAGPDPVFLYEGDTPADARAALPGKACQNIRTDFVPREAR